VHDKEMLSESLSLFAVMPTFNDSWNSIMIIYVLLLCSIVGLTLLFYLCGCIFNSCKRLLNNILWGKCDLLESTVATNCALKIFRTMNNDQFKFCFKSAKNIDISRWIHAFIVSFIYFHLISQTYIILINVDSYYRKKISSSNTYTLVIKKKYCVTSWVRTTQTFSVITSNIS